MPDLKSFQGDLSLPLQPDAVAAGGRGGPWDLSESPTVDQWTRSLGNTLVDSTAATGEDKRFDLRLPEKSSKWRTVLLASGASKKCLKPTDGFLK